MRNLALLFCVLSVAFAPLANSGNSGPSQRPDLYNPGSTFNNQYPGYRGHPSELYTNPGHIYHGKENTGYPTNYSGWDTGDFGYLRNPPASTDPGICLGCFENRQSPGRDTLGSILGFVGQIAGPVMGFLSARQQNKVTERFIKSQEKLADKRFKNERENWKTYYDVYERMGFIPMAPNGLAGGLGEAICGGAPMSCTGAIPPELALSLNQYPLPNGNFNPGGIGALDAPIYGMMGPDFNFGTGPQTASCGPGGIFCAGGGFGLDSGLGCYGSTCAPYGEAPGGLGMLPPSYGGIPGMGATAGGGIFLGVDANRNVSFGLDSSGGGNRYGYPGFLDFGRGSGIDTALFGHGVYGVPNSGAGYQHPFGGGQNSYLGGFNPYGSGVQGYGPGHYTGLNNYDPAFADYQRQHYWSHGGGGAHYEQNRMAAQNLESEIARYQERLKDLEQARDRAREVESIQRQMEELSQKHRDLISQQRILLSANQTPPSFSTRPGYPVGSPRGPGILPAGTEAPGIGGPGIGAEPSSSPSPGASPARGAGPGSIQVQ